MHGEDTHQIGEGENSRKIMEWWDLAICVLCYFKKERSEANFV